jgi:prepilin-type N-terminal cleavage/methylation domain-containing protein
MSNKIPNSKFPASPAGRQIPNSAQGFTLIELLVVMAMTAMIAGVTIANFRTGEKNKRAQIAVDTVVNAIRNAQNFMLTGKNTNNPNAACRVPQYYVITFNYQTSAVLSALNNNTGVCGVTPDTIETYALPVNTRVKANGLVLDAATATTNLTLVFYPPFGVIKAARDNDAYSSFTTATISVETSDSVVTKTVTIDGVAGRIGE